MSTEAQRVGAACLASAVDVALDGLRRERGVLLEPIRVAAHHRDGYPRGGLDYYCVDVRSSAWGWASVTVRASRLRQPRAFLIAYLRDALRAQLFGRDRQGQTILGGLTRCQIHVRRVVGGRLTPCRLFTQD